MSAGTKEGQQQDRHLQPLPFPKCIGFKRALPSRGGSLALKSPLYELHREETKALELLLAANCWETWPDPCAVQASNLPHPSYLVPGPHAGIPGTHPHFHPAIAGQTAQTTYSQAGELGIGASGWHMPCA